MSNITELELAADRAINVGLNKSGSFKFTLPSSDEKSILVAPVSTGVIAYRNNNIVWSGMVWQVEDSFADQKTTVDCIGWFERLNRRLNDSLYTSVTQDAGLIAAELLAMANLQSSTGIEIGEIEPSFNVSYPQTLIYTKKIGEIIQELSQVENGYDYEITPGGRVLNIYKKKGTIKPNCHFAYGISPDNLNPPTFQFDGSQLANDFIASGSGGGLVPQRVWDDNSISTYGRFMDSGLISADTTAKLTGFAGAEVAVRLKPRATFSLAPIPETKPYPFEDYNVGDTVSFTTVGGRQDVTKQLVRIFNMSVTIDNNGIERVTELQTTA